MAIPSKIRLAHVVGSLSYGGAENQVVQLLNGMNPFRFEKYLVTFKNVDTANSRALNPDVKHFNLHLRRWGQIGCIIKLYRLFKHLKIDVVQSHMFYTNLYVAIGAKLAGVPVIMTTEHGKNLWKRPVYHLIERRIISPLTSLRVAVSQDIRSIRIRSGDVPKDKITVITPCVKIPESKSKCKPRERLKIGTVGRLVAAKDYGTLIMAFKNLIEDGVKAELIFVGDGPERAELEQMAVHTGIKKYITFAGFRANVNSFLSDFDIFVLSSIREGLPVAMLEAMAMGLPVVATKVGGIPEVIQDNASGLLVESRSPVAMADTLKKMIKDPALRMGIGEKARQMVKNSFSTEAICLTYERLYTNLLGQHQHV